MLHGGWRPCVTHEALYNIGWCNSRRPLLTLGHRLCTRCRPLLPAAALRMSSSTRILKKQLAALRAASSGGIDKPQGTKGPAVKRKERRKRKSKAQVCHCRQVQFNAYVPARGVEGGSMHQACAGLEQQRCRRASEMNSLPNNRCAAGRPCRGGGGQPALLHQDQGSRRAQPGSSGKGL